MSNIEYMSADNEENNEKTSKNAKQNTEKASEYVKLRICRFC